MKVHKLNENEHISIEVIGEIINEGKNYVLNSRTNTGKTEACIKAAQKSGFAFVFAVDTKILANQLGIKYNLPVYYAGKEKPTGNCVTLYNHIQYFRGENRLLFLDEFHSLVKDYGYKRSLIDTVINEFQFFKQVIGLTGTPLANIEGFTEFKIVSPRQKRKIQLINFKKNYINHLIYNILSNENKIHYISVFDKSHDAETIAATLEAHGILREEIALLNSETKDSKAFKDIVTHRKTSGIRVAITTYTQGFNIEGEGYMLHIIPKLNAFHSIADIEQVVNRFRDEVPIINLYWNHTNGYNTDFCEIKQFEMELQSARNLISNFLGAFNLTPLNTFNPTQLTMLSNHLNSEHILNVTMSCKPNILGVHYNVYSKQTTEMYLDLNYMKLLLKEFDYEVEQVLVGKLLSQSSTEKTQNIKDSIQRLKEERLLNRISELHDNGVSQNSTDEISMRYKKLLQYYTKEDAYKKLRTILLDKKKWNKELDILHVKHSKDMASVVLKESIYSNFTEDKYSSSQIFDKINAIHKKLNIPLVLTYTKATKMLDKYFDTLPWRVQTGIGGRVSGRKIIKKLAA